MWKTKMQVYTRLLSYISRDFLQLEILVSNTMILQGLYEP